MSRRLWKWLFCSWAHREHRCHPRDYTYWHCQRCHPCGEEIDRLIATLRTDEEAIASDWKAVGDDIRAAMDQVDEEIERSRNAK
jgi:hypothetical protein